MKHNLPLKYSLYALFILSCIMGYTRKYEETKKTIEKSYKVDPSKWLSIENKFGDVRINEWAKDEFAVKIELIAKGRNEERSQRILDKLSIDIDEGSYEIAFETEVDKMKNRNEEGFEVNYTVYMPAANPLRIKNSFGDVAMGDRSGELRLTVAYGSLKVGEVEKEAEIKLSFGNGTITHLEKAEVTVKYSELEIESGSNLEVTQGFSEIEFGEIGKIELESKYGDVEFEKLHTIEGEVQFSGFEIEELTNHLELECSYVGDFLIERLAKTFTLVDIEGKFGSYEIGVEPGVDANIDAEFSFANLKYDSDMSIDFTYKVKESNRNSYRGTIGSGSADRLIKIESSYGNLRLKED